MTVPDLHMYVKNSPKTHTHTPKTQVKAFLADARPANFRRPASAPAHFDPGGGSGGINAAGGGGGLGGGGGGGVADRSRPAGGGRGAAAGEPRRPGTASAALGGAGARVGSWDNQVQYWRNV